MANSRAGSDGVEREVQKRLVALAARDGKPMEQMTVPEARACFWPMTDARFDTPSYEQFSDATS